MWAGQDSDTRRRHVKCSWNMYTGQRRTQSDVEPTSQQLQQPGQALQQRQLQLVVIGQVDQDGAQGQLQQALGHLMVADNMRQALLGCRDDGLVRAGQVLEEELDDILAQIW